MGRRLSAATCCRWTPSDACGSDMTEGCSMLHEYLETKTTTHEFAAVETCLGGNDHSNFKASFDGTDGNVSLSYGISQVTSFKTPLKVWHAQSCSSTPPTLSLQLNTVADGTFTVGHVDVGAALKQPQIAPRFPNNALLGSSSDARNVIILEGALTGYWADPTLDAQVAECTSCPVSATEKSWILAMSDTQDFQAGLLKMVLIKVTQSGGHVYLTQVAAGGNQDASLTLQKAPSALDLNSEWSNRDTGYAMATSETTQAWGAAHVKYVIAEAWG